MEALVEKQGLVSDYQYVASKIGYAHASGQWAMPWPTDATPSLYSMSSAKKSGNDEMLNDKCSQFR